MVLNCDIRQGHVFAFPLCCNWGYLHRLSAGSPKGECRKRERQVAGSCEPASRRRKRASLHQPVVLAIANKNKAAAAVLLSVNRGCNGQRGTACTAPRQTTSKRSNKAGVTEGKGLEIVAPPQLGWEKIRFGSEMCDMAHSLVEKENHTRSIDGCVPQRPVPSELEPRVSPSDSEDR
jgi:hypothetical protein